MKVTVSEFALAAVTLPAPELKTTLLLPGVELKPVPLIVIEVALAARLAVFKVTVGAIVTVAVAAGALSTCPLSVERPAVEPAVKVDVAWRLAIVPVVGATLPNGSLANVAVNPFITVGLIVVPTEFLLKSAVSVELPPALTEEGAAVSTRSMRGLEMIAPAPATCTS